MTIATFIAFLIFASGVGVIIGWFRGHSQGFDLGTESGFGRGYYTREIEANLDKIEAQRAQWAIEDAEWAIEDAEYAERRRIADEEWAASMAWLESRGGTQPAPAEIEAEVVHFPEWTDAELDAINASLSGIPGPEAAR